MHHRVLKKYYLVIIEFVNWFFQGNKIDLNRSVKHSDAKLYTENLKMDYLETSAKTGENVEKLFTNLAEIILKKVDSDDIDLTNEVNTFDYIQ